MDAASHNSVDDIRELRENVGLAPMEGGSHVPYILDEAHMLTPAGVERIPEDPRGAAAARSVRAGRQGAQGAARDRRPLPPVRLQRPSLGQIAFVLKRVAEQEEIEVPDPALGMIARAATGSFRDALGTLEQLVTYGKNVELDNVLEDPGRGRRRARARRRRRARGSRPQAALACVQLLSDSSRDFTQFMRDLTSHLRHLLVVKLTGEFPQSFSVTAAHPERVTAQADRIAQGEIVPGVEFLGAAIAAVKEGSDPRIQLELALLKSTQPQADLSPGAHVPDRKRLEQEARGAGEASAPEQPEARAARRRAEVGRRAPGRRRRRWLAEPENEPVAEAAPTPTSSTCSRSGRRWRTPSASAAGCWSALLARRPGRSRSRGTCSRSRSPRTPPSARRRRRQTASWWSKP